MLTRTNEDECPAFFQTSLRQLDDVLHGGLPAGTITEVSSGHFFRFVFVCVPCDKNNLNIWRTMDPEEEYNHNQH